MHDVQSVEPEVVMPSKTVQEASSDLFRHTDKSVLERPTLIGTVEWTTANQALPTSKSAIEFASLVTPIASYNLPVDIVHANPRVQAYLNYFRFLKCDMELEIKTNQEPFQQGMLGMFYLPLDMAIPSRRITRDYLAALSVYPHATINLQEQTSAKLCVPYSSITDSLDIPVVNSEQAGSVNPNLGQLFLYPITPLRGVSDAESINIQVFARMTNVTISTATRSVAFPKTTAIQSEGFADYIPDFVRHFTTPQSVVNIPGSGLGYGDMDDNSVKLSLCKANKLSVAKQVAADQDEMSLNYVCGRFNKVQTWNFTKTNFVKGNEMAIVDVSPVIRAQSDTDPAYYLGSLGNVASMFRYWRGGLKFRMTIIKTKFHTGRLAIVWDRAEGSGNGSVLGQQLSTCYNILYDLKSTDDETSSTLEFTIPYISNVPWAKVGLGFNGLETTNGRLRIYALSNLQSPDTVADSVDVLLEVAGDSDLQFAFPSLDYNFGTSIVPVEIQAEGATPFIPNTVSSDVEHSTFGEKITSLKQLASRSCPSFEINSDVSFNFHPEMGSVNQVTGCRDIDAKSVVAAYPTTFVSRVREMFLLRSGSYRIKMLLSPDQVATVGLIPWLSNSINTNVEDSGYFDQRPNPVMYYNGTVNNMVEVEVPFYSPVRSVTRYYHQDQSVAISGFHYPQLYAKVRGAAGESPVIMLESLGSDAYFHYLIPGGCVYRTNPVPLGIPNSI